MFSALWGEQVNESVRLIIAVVDKGYVNEIARRVHTIAESEASGAEVLVTAQDLLYASGSLSF